MRGSRACPALEAALTRRADLVFDSSLTLRLLTGEPSEMAALQGVLEAASDYFATITGRPPGSAEAQNTFTALPPGKDYDAKYVWGLYKADTMIGCADVIRGHPIRDKAVIGLLLLAKPWQGRGLGRAFALLVEELIRGWPEISSLRIGVVASNDRALAFWEKIGYRRTGETRSGGRDFVADIVVLEKAVSPCELAT